VKQHIRELVEQAIQQLRKSGKLELTADPSINVERTRDQSHGDFATNIAMMLAKQAKSNPRELAQKIVDALPKSEQVVKTEIAGPGFINFYLAAAAYEQVVCTVLDAAAKYGFPSNGYQGDYIWDIAADLHRENGDSFRHPIATVMAEVPADVDDKELHIDGIIENAKTLLGDSYRVVHRAAIDAILGDIREDLADFGVEYDEWFSEYSLESFIDKAIEKLQQSGDVFEQDGALWFRSTKYGDEKDRVVVRENGLKTYFASDIAYHLNKLERGFSTMIDIWGADHHGYVPRVRAALSAMGKQSEQLEVQLVQFASLYRGGEKVQMSTRSGSFVTLRELREEVGNDAARFFYVMRKSEQHMDFDLDLARSQSSENPVYYIQYAHARIYSVMRQLKERKLSWDEREGRGNLHLLTESHEKELMLAMARYPELIESAAQQREPHQLAHYLRDLAHLLHTYYNAHHFIVDEQQLRNARLTLVLATRQIFANGLAILGVSSPEEM